MIKGIEPSQQASWMEKFQADGDIVIIISVFLVIIANAIRYFCVSS